VTSRGLVLATVLATALGAVPAAAQIYSGRIVGTIVDDKGEAVAGATVEAQNRDATPPVRTATTDEHGRFGVMGLRTGTWMVVVEAKGHEPSMLAIPVQAQRPGGPVTIPLVKIEERHTPTFSQVSAAAVMQELDQADALAADGKVDAALAIYEGLLKKAPALTSVQLAIARVARGARDYVRAQAALAALLARDPASLPARYELGITLEAAGDPAGARRELERVAQEGGDARPAVLARERLATLPR
jgi:tetratricopeptide (TPR) repeat protein